PGYIEKAAKLKAKVKSAMVYPVTIIGVACLVIIFMMIFVLPTFANMFKNMGAELPLPTKIVMWMSDMTRKYVIVMLAGVAAAFYAIKRYYGTDQGSMLIDTFALKVPVIGMLIRKVAVARFTRTLGTLISSGVRILEGLLITARSAGNRVVEKAVMQARQHVTAGGTLPGPLKAAPGRAPAPAGHPPAHGDDARHLPRRPRAGAPHGGHLLRRSPVRSAARAPAADRLAHRPPRRGPRHRGGGRHRRPALDLHLPLRDAGDGVVRDALAHGRPHHRGGRV